MTDVWVVASVETVCLDGGGANVSVAASTMPVGHQSINEYHLLVVFGLSSIIASRLLKCKAFFYL